jgi:signal transduction histidine kinase/CheY-like chemotaxis protein
MRRVSPRAAQVAEVALLAVVYAVAGCLGLRADAVGGFASAMWLPSGIALAAVLLRGNGMWPGIAAGALAVNLWAGAPLAAAAVIAAGNTVEALLGAAALRSLGFRFSLDRVRDVLALTGVAAVTTVFSATIGVTTLYVAGIVSADTVALAWRTWWLGDATNELLVTPLILTFAAARWPPRLPRPRQIAEAAALGLLIAAVWGFLLAPMPAQVQPMRKSYLVFPLFVWPALRFGPRGVAVTAMLVYAAAIAGTVNGLGPFADPNLLSSLMSVQAFLAVVTATGLVLAASIAERRCAEEALRDADRRKDEFLAMLSHELRNPLAPIRNSAYLLQRADPASERAARARAVIERQVNHLSRLVDDLLDVTRIARGKIELRRERVDLNEVVRGAAEDHASLLREHRVALELRTARAPIWIDGDATRLAQIVGNLVHNAAKFTPPGGTTTLEVAANPEGAAIRVRDTGPGIDGALIQRLFQPFVQGDRTLARGQGGLGLGLALVKGLTELHGGSVEARNVSPGAEFVVRLPLAQAPAVAPEPEVVRMRELGMRHRVLVVEDNRDVAESLAEMVGAFGHDVEIAGDGPTALAKAHARRPDLVLCDIGLPGMDGYEVARAFRADPALNSAQLVALSGYAQPEDVREARTAGFDRHIAKPADPDEIERLLAH